MRKGCWWGAVGIGVAGLFAANRVFTNYWDFNAAAAELPEAVRAYRAAGLPWTSADLDRHVKPEENAEPMLRKALAAMPKGKELGLFEKALSQGNADPSPFAPALAFVHQAVEFSQLDMHRDLDTQYSIPEARSSRLLVRALVTRAKLHAKAGDDGKAIADLRDASLLASLIGNETSMVDAFVSAANQQIVMDGVAECLVQAAGKVSRLIRYREWLTEEVRLPDLHQALRTEIYGGVVFFRNSDRVGLFRDMNAFNDLDIYISDCSDCVKPVSSPVIRREGFPNGTRPRAYLSRVLRLWTQTAQATHSLTDSVDRICRVVERINEEAMAEKRMSYLIIGGFYGGFGTFGRTNVITQASRAVELAFADALIRHAKTGRWPTTLTAADAAGKGPLKVRMDGNRFRVWSVGSNGLDDDGRTKDETIVTKRRSDDIVAMYPPLPPKPLAPTAVPASANAFD